MAPDFPSEGPDPDDTPSAPPSPPWPSTPPPGPRGPLPPPVPPTPRSTHDDLSSPFGGGRPADEPPVYRPPPPLDDRLWRHPSELAASASTGRTAPAEATPRAGPSAMIVGVVSGLVGSLLTAATIAAFGGFGDRVVQQRVLERENIPALAADVEAGGVVEIAARARPAITRIEVVTGFGGGSGSGVVFRDDGYVLTNSHVVAGATAITVVLSDGRELAGDLVGDDPDTDVAVVRIEGGPFAIATLGSAADLRVGEPAVAIGSPLGLDGGPSVTVGVVSALGRRVNSDTGPPLLDMIQTDAPISPGSSGGALLDGSGAVIGITTAIAVSDVGAEGLGFATPIDIARKVAEDLIAHGSVTHVWMGIEGTDLDAAVAERLDLAGGALVLNVVPDSPAEAAGLRADDVITAVGGEPVDSMAGLVVRLRVLAPGDQIDVEVHRDGEQRSITITLAERPPDL